MEKLTKLPVNKESLKSFRLQYGYEDGGYFYTIAIGGFEERQVNIPASHDQQGLVKIDTSECPLSACGIAISHDVNNRAGKKSDAKNDLKQIVDAQIQSIRKLPETLLLEEILL
jgi:hypothetical protein